MTGNTQNTLGINRSLYMAHVHIFAWTFHIYTDCTFITSSPKAFHVTLVFILHIFTDTNGLFWEVSATPHKRAEVNNNCANKCQDWQR